jgi:arsenate reductase (thioredoxin)
MLFSSIQEYCDLAAAHFSDITEERKLILSKIAQYIQAQLDQDKPVQLMYVCTHNSRRSHFGQVWGAVAAHYYGIPNIHTSSGGTEATAFNINAINALRRIGFVVEPNGAVTNPVYTVQYSEQNAVSCFSKRYDDAANPQSDFAAIMTCGDAEANCPFIPGVQLRIATTYKDPKAFDGTILQDFKYSERCLQIAVEVLYVFSLVSKPLK